MNREQEFRTGQRAPVSGVYHYVRHLEPVECEPTPQEMEIPLARGESFPPDRHCQAGAVWRLEREA